MNNRKVQRKDLAFKKKLTAVTIGKQGRRTTRFVWLNNDENGVAHLPYSTYNEMVADLNGAQCGQTLTIG